MSAVKTENFPFQLLHSYVGDYKTSICNNFVRRCIWGLCLDIYCSYYTRSWQERVLSQNLFRFFLFQTICSTAQKASPQRFSASMSPPWKGTRPTSSEQSFELWGCQTQAPRGMNSGLSSTRCVKVPFPCLSTKIRGKAHSQGNTELPSLFFNVIFDRQFSKNESYISWLIVHHHLISSPNWQRESTDQIVGAGAGKGQTKSQKALKTCRMFAEQGRGSC